MNRPASRFAWRYVEHIANDVAGRSVPVCLNTTAVIAYLTPTERVAPLVARFLDDPRIGIVLLAITRAEAVTRSAMQRTRDASPRSTTPSLT